MAFNTNLGSGYADTMGLQFGSPQQQSLGSYINNSPNNYNGSEIPAKTNVLRKTLGSAAGQSSIYGLASGLVSTIPQIMDIKNLEKEGSATTVFDRYERPEDLEAIKISESSLNPLFNSALNKSRGDIINATGGSGAATRANMLGNNISNTRAKSKALTDLLQYNREQKYKTDATNKQRQDRVSQLNTDIRNKEITANEQNEAAYEAQLNQYKNNLRQTLTNTGSDALSLFMNMNETGYGFNGKIKSKQWQ